MYKIIGKSYNNLNINKYICEDDNHDIKVFNYHQLLNHIANDNISNAHTILSDDNDIMLWTDNDIQEIPEKVKYKVIDKIYADKKIAGFKVQDIENNKSLRLSTKKIWELAVNGLVDKCEAKIHNGEKIILIN